MGVLAHGKTMMARRIPSILPDLNFNEALKWCDTFACCDTLEYDLIVKNDYNKTAESYVEKLIP